MENELHNCWTVKITFNHLIYLFIANVFQVLMLLGSFLQFVAQNA